MKTIEAGTTFGGAIRSQMLVGTTLVVLALGVGAAGGYMAASLGSGKVQSKTEVAPVSTTVAHPDILPGYILNEISPAPTPRLSQDSPEFIAK